MHWLGIPQKSLFLGVGEGGWICGVPSGWPQQLQEAECLSHRVGMITIFKDLTRCLALSRRSVCAVSHCSSSTFSFIHGYLVLAPLDSKLSVEEICASLCWPLSNL